MFYFGMYYAAYSLSFKVNFNNTKKIDDIPILPQHMNNCVDVSRVSSSYIIGQRIFRTNVSISNFHHQQPAA